MRLPGSNRWTLVCALYLCICLVIDFCPSFGAPYFRYTGSDPSVHVWNLGWPLALAIYDSKSGLHVGPFAFIVIGLQAFLFSVVAGSILLKRRKRHNEMLEATPF